MNHAPAPGVTHAPHRLRQTLAAQAPQARRPLPPHVAAARHPLRAAIAGRRHPVMAWLSHAAEHGRYAAHSHSNAAREGLGRIAPAVRAVRVSRGDVRDFLLAYCACFVAAMAFIA